MKPRIWIAIIAVAGASAFLLIRPSPSESIPPTSGSQFEQNSGVMPTPPALTEGEDESTITNYDECLAAGNTPLPDAQDKCLTKGGHIFIQGVIEE